MSSVIRSKIQQTATNCEEVTTYFRQSLETQTTYLTHEMATRLIAWTALFLLARGSSCTGEIGYSESAVNYDAAALIERLRQNARLPSGTDPAFDCAARRLAYNVSVSLQQARGNLQSVWDALELTTLCKQKMPSFAAAYAAVTLRQRKWPDVRSAPRSAPDDVPTFFVDSTRGSDDNPGTLPAPFRTIQRALYAARNIGYGIQRFLYLRAGAYYLNETLRLGAEDSLLTIRSYLDEKVVVSGGRLLDVQWKEYNVSSKDTMVTETGVNNVKDQVGAGRSTATIQ